MSLPPPQKILFVCIGNACRSQMAEGLARHLSGASVAAFSAGSRPAGFVANGAIETMKEIGIDISKQASKSVEAFRGQDFDVVVTMGCGDACPWVPAKRRLDWKIPDPIGQPPEFFRKVRGQIEALVRDLLAEIKKGG
ncbi:arsenate reductase ArsC [Deltaproteobacteria bacterium PRO3]|nr:arsenate reductase ArsC [Deltaproteobacteria bacterium PRO3]